MRTYTSSPTVNYVQDTSIALNKKCIVGVGRPIVAVFVRRITGLASVLLHLGLSDDGHTFRAGDSFEIQDGDISTGLFMTAAAGGAGSSVELELVYELAQVGGSPIQFRSF